MRSHRSRLVAAVRFLLSVQMMLSGKIFLPGNGVPDDSLHLWVCRAEGCRWARLLTINRGDFDRCAAHDDTFVRLAESSDRDRDVKCPDRKCSKTKRIGQYDKKTHTPDYFRCDEHRGSK